MEQKETASKIKEEQKEKILKLSEISLWLDTYDDIFSDFDPRPYSERSLSDDFLLEAKKAAKEKSSGKIELKFLIPDDRRNHELENVIKKRLHGHFKRHHDILHEEMTGIVKNGVAFVAIGVLMMVLAAYVAIMAANNFLLTLVVVLLEPGGWFMLWFGLDKIFYGYNQKNSELQFYEKMTKCEISFLSI